ncbi:MAG: MerR family transcriptional regulator [Succinivibrio sp.]
MEMNIGEVSKQFAIPVSTLRYYDQEGLFPELSRKSGIRKFSERDLGALRVIECLKKSGLEIKDIKQFMLWCKEGADTYEQRKALFEKQKEQVCLEMEKLSKVMAMLEFKIWYYTQAIKDGSEEKLKSMIPDRLPERIRDLWKKTHDDDSLLSEKK